MLILIDSDYHSADILSPIAARLQQKFHVESSLSRFLNSPPVSEEVLDLCIISTSGPSFSEIDFLPALQKRAPYAKFLFTATDPDPLAVVRALKSGALDFLPKPLCVVRSFQVLQNIFNQRQQSIERRYRNNIVGDSENFLTALEKIDCYVGQNNSFVIYGEAGVGKGLISETICLHSEKLPHQPRFLNLSLIPKPLIGVSLFGHCGTGNELGSQPLGAIAQADSGTLIIRNVQLLSAKDQLSLFNFLKFGKYLDSSDRRELKSDTRVIVIADSKLRSSVDAGAFLPELFGLLASCSVELPALREREIDIPLLVQEFLNRFAKLTERPAPVVTDEALSGLLSYDYPGNVGELFTIMHGAILCSKGGSIDLANLPPHVNSSGSFSNNILEENRQRTILRVLGNCGGNQTEAATQLGIARGTLNRFLRELTPKK